MQMLVIKGMKKVYRVLALTMVMVMAVLLLPKFDAWSVYANAEEEEDVYEITNNSTDHTYRVTLDTNDLVENTEGKTVKVVYRIKPGKTITLPDMTREEEGMAFDGWYDAAVGGTAIAKTVSITSDVEWFAHWKLATYHITYQLDGGAFDEETVAPTTYTIKTPTFTLETPEKEGYEFLGWTGTDLTEMQEEVSIAEGSIGDRSYTAVWKLQKTTPEKPAPPVLESKTDSSITVVAVEGQEYSIDGGENWQDSNAFEELEAATSYSVITRVKETETNFESEASEPLAVTTEQAEPETSEEPEEAEEPGDNELDDGENVDEPEVPEEAPTVAPTEVPTPVPTEAPTVVPTEVPTAVPVVTENVATPEVTAVVTPTAVATQIPYHKLTPEEERLVRIAISSQLDCQQTKKKVTIAWTRLENAGIYNIAYARCGTSFKHSLWLRNKKLYKNGKVVSGAKVKMTGKQIKITVPRKVLFGKETEEDLAKQFKVCITAYANNKNQKLASGIIIHMAGVGNEKYCNVKKINLQTNTYQLAVGEKKKIKAKLVLSDKKKKHLSDDHAPVFRYISIDRNVAKVDQEGNIKAVAAGTSTIYVYAVDGHAEKISVTVQ